MVEESERGVVVGPTHKLFPINGAYVHGGLHLGIGGQALEVCVTVCVCIIVVVDVVFCCTFLLVCCAVEFLVEGINLLSCRSTDRGSSLYCAVIFFLIFCVFSLSDHDYCDGKYRSKRAKTAS